MTARRARYGTGSITSRGTGRWQIRLSAGTDPVTGRRRVITETVVGTKRDAQARVEQLQRDHRMNPTSSAATVAVLAGEWRQHLGNRATQTRANYERTLDRDLLPLLGSIRLDKLTTLEVQRAYLALERRGAGVHTIRQAHAVLSKMLADGCRWGWLTRNVAEHATIPALPPRQARAIDPGDVGRLITAASQEGPLVELWIHLHLVTAARRSEVLALTWADVDLVDGMVRFSHVLERGPDGSPVRRPGTKTGTIKTVPIGARTVEMLTRRLAWCTTVLDEAPPATGFVVSDLPDGSTPWRLDTASRRFAALCRTAKVSGARLHDLRHTAVSAVIAATGDLLLASRLAGHSRTATTTETYGHVMADQLRRGTDALDHLAHGG